jgi:hypothetical protein
VRNTALALLVFAGLRHLNTVPHREFGEGNWKYADGPGPESGWYIDENGKTALHHREYYGTKVYTAESLFGSSYRAKRGDTDLGISSKNFGDVFLQTFGSSLGRIQQLRAIDP